MTFCCDHYRVSSLSSETLPLLCVTFITENSLIAAVSIQHRSITLSDHTQARHAELIRLYLIIFHSWWYISLDGLISPCDWVGLFFSDKIYVQPINLVSIYEAHYAFTFFFKP